MYSAIYQVLHKKRIIFECALSATLIYILVMFKINCFTFHFIIRMEFPNVIPHLFHAREGYFTRSRTRRVILFRVLFAYAA